RSGPPRPEVLIELVEHIDLAGEIPADGHVVLGAVLLKADQYTSIECRAQAQFTAAVTVQLADAAPLAASFRRYRRGDDEKDRGWLKADETVIDRLEFDPVEERFSIDRLDFAISYQALRQLLS